MRMQAMTRKTRILDVVYNASNNELVGSLPVPNADPDVMSIASLLHHVGSCPDLMHARSCLPQGAAQSCWLRQSMYILLHLSPRLFLGS